jgi:Tfp pilus assembly protein PilX
VKNFPRINRGCTGDTLKNSESGVILIAALTLLATLTLVGATAFIIASTDVKIGGNFQTSQKALQVAMAGAEQARQTLRAANASSTNSSNFSEELAARVGANGVLNGYTSSTDDSALASSSTLVTGYTYTAYLTNDSTEGSASTVDNNGKVIITSVATGPQNTKAIVQTTIQLYSLSTSSPAVVYSKDNVTLSGSSLSINGNDSGSCGGGNLGTVYTKDPATTTSNGGPGLSGNPAAPQHGAIDIDLDALVNQFKNAANYTLTADVSGATYGSATNYVTVYSDAIGTQADDELRLNNVTGYGILIVKGDLQMAGNLNWNGIIIVTGVLKSSGGGSAGKNIQGQVYSGSSALGDTTISGNIDITYNSCEVKKSVSSQPLKVVNWKQDY